MFPLVFVLSATMNPCRGSMTFGSSSLANDSRRSIFPYLVSFSFSLMPYFFFPSCVSLSPSLFLFLQEPRLMIMMGVCLDVTVDVFPLLLLVCLFVFLAFFVSVARLLLSQYVL